MIDDEIRSLLKAEPARSLDRLEADIWAGVANRTATNRLSRTIVAYQALVMVVALAGSIAASSSAIEQTTEPAAAESVFSTRPVLAPSTLLLGERA